MQASASQTQSHLGRSSEQCRVGSEFLISRLGWGPGTYLRSKFAGEGEVQQCCGLGSARLLAGVRAEQRKQEQ